MAGEVDGRSAGERGAADESLSTDQWREEGPWLVLLLLPLAALAFRRGWMLMLLVFVLPVQPAQASLMDDVLDLFKNNNQQARDALANGDPEIAAELFDDPDWRDVARYRMGDYEEAARGFAEAGDARSLYNLGNAMAKQGEFESAIDAYEQVLEMDPSDEDAAYNRDLVKEVLEQQQQQQQEQQQSEQGEGEGEESDSENDQQSEQDGEQSDGQSDGDSQDADAEQQDPSEEDLEALQEELERAAEEQQESEQQLTEAELAELRRAQEQEQAMEQWLRRIPNDPGGLLRRKFRYQYQRMGQDQDGNNLWPDDEVQPW